MDWPFAAKCEATRPTELYYILLLTSKQDSEDIVAGLEAGADDYLTKPCQAAELRARLRTGRRILSPRGKACPCPGRDASQSHPRWPHWYLESIRHSLPEPECDSSFHPATVFFSLLCDIDHFKKINDNYGHLTGDLVLQEVARRLRSAVRDSDAVGRYGGEEFLIVFNDCHQSALQARADAIRTIVSSTPILANTHRVPVTVSIGASSCEVHDKETSIEQILASADAALYEAKRQGRNRALLSDRLVMY